MAPVKDGCPGSTDATRILDHTSEAVQSLLRDCHRSTTQGDVTGVLRVAHGLIAERVRPVYAVEDTQPVSHTLRRGRGSCSQRLAILERCVTDAINGGDPLIYDELMRVVFKHR